MQPMTVVSPPRSWNGKASQKYVTSRFTLYPNGKAGKDLNKSFLHQAIGELEHWVGWEAQEDLEEFLEVLVLV